MCIASRSPVNCIVPDHVLRRIAERGDDEQRRAALDTLSVSITLRSARTQAEARGAARGREPVASLAALRPPAVQRLIRDANHTTDVMARVVRQEGQEAIGDAAVDEAYEYLGDTWEFFFQVFARNSIDQRGMTIEGVVHYKESYYNAFWNGEQMVFGDGSDRIFTRMTQSLSVCAHELGHGVIQYDGPLIYQREAGALNESTADAFGAMVDQWKRGETADQADWLIGREILAEEVTGKALRSMKEPGTAYDDDLLGADEQPGNMNDFVETEEDHGGVHINSGIPNRAFFLVATELGGHSWDEAGRIWYATLGHERLRPNATFRQFARLTRHVAGVIYGPQSKQVHAVESGWSQVGVER